MAARGSDPVRRRRPAARPDPRSSERGQQPADAGPAASGFVALAGLAVTAPGPHEQPDPLAVGLRALSPRPKLLVGSAADQAEVEADAMADAAVSRMPAPERPDVLGALRRTPASPAPPTGTGAAIGLAGGEVDSHTEQALSAARTSGAGLAPALRREYEDAFDNAGLRLDADFSAVRVHSGPASARLNSALGARAFTLGSDIYFGDRVPGSASADDRHLMAHELAHTLQDGGTAHRQVLRRLAVQIIPSWESAGTATTSDAVMLPDMEEEPDTAAPGDAHPGEAVIGEAMLPEYAATDPHAAPALELIIESVAIVGRPTTLFTGSMGDHMTAFVISRKGVENAVFNQPFTVAVSELDEMAGDLRKLPGWNLVDSLKPVEVEEEEPVIGTEVAVGLGATSAAGESIGSAPGDSPAITGEPDLDDDEHPAVEAGPYQRASHYARFRAAELNLTHCRLLLDAADTDDLKVLRLQDYIAAYLELRELIPLSASNWKGANRGKGGTGDGETGLEGFLAEPRTQRKGHLRRDFLSTIATYRMAQAAIEPNKDALAILMPGLDHALSADERTELMARQHVQTVLSNFPQNFPGLADDISLAEGGKPAGKADDPDGARDQAADFTTILNHLTRIVRMRYAEAAQREYTHQMEVARLCRDSGDVEQARTAEADAVALTAYLPKSAPARMKASTLTEEDKAKGRVDKRERDSSSDDDEGVDELIRGLSAEQARKVFTGRDGFTKRKTDPPNPLPKSDLAVQILLDDAGAVRGAKVGRQGRYTKGAHTIPWIQWVIWLNTDIVGKQPAAALADFTTTTVPAIRSKLASDDAATSTASPVVPPELAAALATPTGALPPEPIGIDIDIDIAVGESEEAEEQPPVSVPLVELQLAIADMLDEITDAADSSVLDATDTGGKGEHYHRVELAAYERNERAFSPEELMAHILALCDVGEAEPALARRTVKKVLIGAAKDYSKAYAASLLSGYDVDDPNDLDDLAEQASLGKGGEYKQEESEAESESESDPDDRKPPTKRKKKGTKGK